MKKLEEFIGIATEPQTGGDGLIEEIVIDYTKRSVTPPDKEV